MNNQLEEYRKEIDKIDEELLQILQKRFTVVKKIGRIKKEKNIPPLDEKRWQEVLNKITKKAEKTGLSKNLVTKIYAEIHMTALKIEKDHE
jgi:chorismate mutase